MPSTNKKSDHGLFGLTAVELATILPLSKKMASSPRSCPASPAKHSKLITQTKSSSLAAKGGACAEAMH